MKIMKQAFSFFVLSSFVIVLSSAKIDNATQTTPPVVTEQSTVAEQKELSYNELKTMVAELKGEKLSFKEKVALKLYKKKIANSFQGAAAEGKSQLTAALLAFFLGGIGIHRFYLGYTTIGILQILTLGGLGIWALIDFIRILTGDLKPKDGEYGTTL
ncbi:MAG: hypothetical protein JWQ96_2041 [Segetibacter sp.]|nr:hypothetical protein [Segetibacter sp.]